MNEIKENVPKLRFPGFTDAWEQRKLGEIYTERKERGNDSLPILSVSIHHGVSNEELDSDALGKNVRRSEDKSLYRHVYLGDLVFNMMRAWQGAIGVVKSEGMVSPAYITAIPSAQLYPLFMDYCLRRDEAINQIDNLSYGVTDFRKRLYWDSFINVLCRIPSVPEQEMITAFFTHLDQLITLHQRKLNNVKNVKAGLLQKMFPKDGENFPEVRFPGFTDAWEQRRLGELAEFNPKSILPDEFEYVDLGSVVGTELITHRTESKESAPSRAQRLAQRGDVFYQTVRPYQKNNYLYDLPYDNYVFSTGYAQMRPSIDSYFLLSCVQEEFFVKTVLDRSTGTSYPAINSNDLAEIEIKVPIDSNEQVKIGSFFRDLDNLITLHQRKLEHLQEQKKALLQQMFV
ncbi:restriction endonuclease subunit S [Paenibacillus sp. FSL W7-1332]|uniref:restriction endonuclease subunit S n=1 Tax=Paenibacillus sp. FSL W7-1332 TaxID=2921702 RepID=UPI0030D1406B